MKALLLHLAWPVLLLAAGLAAYDHWVIRPALRVGVVDVGEVYRQKEAEFARLLTQAGGDEERTRAMALARRFAQRLPLALGELPGECGCLVLVKGALAGDSMRTVDLTASLKRKVEAP